MAYGCDTCKNNVREKRHKPICIGCIYDNGVYSNHEPIEQATPSELHYSLINGLERRKDLIIINDKLKYKDKEVPFTESKFEDICIWTREWPRAFRSHFVISCNSKIHVDGNFKGKEIGSRWEFIHCPYCGLKIKSEDNE